MLQSMTGYGLATIETEGLSLTIEVKTLNSKFLETNLRLPREYNDREIELRNLIAAHLERGKVNVSIERSTKKLNKGKAHLDTELLQHYYQQLHAAAQQLGAETSDLFRLALHMPDVLHSNAEAAPEENPEDPSLVLGCLQQALQQCIAFRQREGAALCEKLQENSATIRSLLHQVIAADPARLAAARTKLLARLADLGLTTVDEGRFEQELIYHLERLDINEEKVRLETHLDYFDTAMSEGNGKRLGFLAQEIGREINTIGSKCNDASMQHLVVQMKEELEKIKEQSLNLV